MKRQRGISENMALVLLAVASVLGALALMWLAYGNQFFLYKFFAPKVEEVRRETFEQSKAFKDGANQNLWALRLEYEKASPELKPSVAHLIRAQAAGVSRDSLDPELRRFLEELP